MGNDDRDGDHDCKWPAGIELKPLLPKLWFSSMLKLASARLLERNDAS